jgi:menaquinone-specific isochorismate synthase
MVLGFGTAAVLELAGGLTDPSSLELVLEDLKAIAPYSDGQSSTSKAGLAADCDRAPVPLALGALRFDRRADGELVVPELTVVAAGRSLTALIVGSRERVGDLLAQLSRGLPEIVTSSPESELTPPDEFRLASARPHQDFLNRVSAALAEIASGSLDKVVLAREVTVHANRPFLKADLLSRLRALHPSCTAFAIDGFIGATPELLICRSGARIASQPLAGTAARSGDADADSKAEAALLASSKERSEHRVVVDTIASALAPVVAHLEVPDGPAIRELRNVSHLGTSITGTLAERDGDYPSALELVALLHPTPAVAGTPVDLALDYLAKLEEIDRDRYAGPVGWVDARGDGEWHLGIRSAIVTGCAARLFAGVGIVADSDPAAELAETQLKLQAFLAAAVRP